MKNEPPRQENLTCMCLNHNTNQHKLRNGLGTINTTKKPIFKKTGIAFKIGSLNRGIPCNIKRERKNSVISPIQKMNNENLTIVFVILLVFYYIYSIVKF